MRILLSHRGLDTVKKEKKISSYIRKFRRDLPPHIWRTYFPAHSTWLTLYRQGCCPCPCVMFELLCVSYSQLAWVNCLFVAQQVVAANPLKIPPIQCRCNGRCLILWQPLKMKPPLGSHLGFFICYRPLPPSNPLSRVLKRRKKDFLIVIISSFIRKCAIVLSHMRGKLFLYCVKRTVTWDFRLQVFFINQFPPGGGGVYGGAWVSNYMGGCNW